MALNVDKVKKDPDGVLKDKVLLKELVSDGELVTILLKEKGLNELTVEVDGEPVHLVYTTLPPLI